MNKLYFGDNLNVLREHVRSASVDLVYLDPPFNSQARYNVLFKSPKEDVASAQVAAFVDFWSWGPEAEAAYHEIMTSVGGTTATIVEALRTALGESDMMAYLVMMAVRLNELRRVLKPDGSLLLHCDPTASHYLKVLLDGVFGPAGFTNELIWLRSTPKGHATTRFPSAHDVILFYRGKERGTWNPQHLPHRQEYVDQYYTLIDEESGRRFQATSLINPNSDRPHLTYEFGGHTKVWRWTKDRMKQAVKEGRIYFPAGGGVPREKRYLDEQEGTPVTSVWTDIPPVNARAIERIGYPTQKPAALLHRIISAVSNPGDTVLDPFCGCGTTVHAAEDLKRRWIGIDVSIHSIHVIEERLREAFGPKRVPQPEGIPADYESAARLADENPFQFQWWANYLVGVHVLKEVKRGADRGIDGEMFFPNGPGKPYGRLLTSVKGGRNVSPAMIREFRGVLERERAEIGLFICRDAPTAAMEREAVSAGFARTVHGQIPRLQIMAVSDWFDGRRPVLPPNERLPYAAFSAPRKVAKKGRKPDPNAPELPFVFSGGKATDVVHLNPARVERGDADLVSIAKS